MHCLAGAQHASFHIPNICYGLFLRMIRFMTQGETEVQKTFTRCVFNVCMNNQDDHTKNFADLMNLRGEWKLAPAYDLTFNIGLNGHHQIDIDGASLNPTRDDLLNLALNSGLSTRFRTQTINHIAAISD